jgi:DNA-binding protein YbaB
MSEFPIDSTSTKHFREEAERLGAALAETATRHYEVISPNEQVTVVADGRPRLLRIVLDPRIMRSGAEAIGELLTATIGTALAEANQSRNAAMEQLLPPGILDAGETLRQLLPTDGQSTTPGPFSVVDDAMRRLSETLAAQEERVAALTAEPVFGQAAEGKVAVRLSGTGEVEAVEIAPALLRSPDSAELAEQVVTATNGALEELASRVPAVEPPDAGFAEIDAALDAFNAKMDGLLGKLDEIERQLPPPPA